jgi:ATP-dependent exoDNAse (exonuclease V) alpha subunit
MKTQSELENLSNPRVNDTISLIKNSGLFRSDHHNILINEIINFNNNVIKTILDTSLQPSKRVIKINEYKDGIIRLLTGDFLIPGKTVSHPGGINGLITDSINKITDDTTKELEEDAGIELGQGKTIIPMECIFAKVGGGSSKDVIHCRDQPNKSAKSLGLLKKKNCPDNKTFIVDANRGSGDYRALLNPSKYGIKVKKGTVVYVNIKDKDIKTTDVTHVIDFDPVAVRRGRSIIFDKVDRDGYPSEITGKLKSSKGNEGTTKGRKIKDTNTRTDILPNIGDIGTYQNEPVLDRLKKNKNYFNNYTDKDIDDHKTISENLNIIANNEENNIKKAMMELFNRYRLSYPSNQLSKSFGHVFFTRPSLNIYDNFEGGILNKQANSDATFYFLNQVNQSVLKSLCSEFDNSHRFFPFLSNMAQTFEVSDEVINTAEQGETLTGHKIKILA